MGGIGGIGGASGVGAMNPIDAALDMGNMGMGGGVGGRALSLNKGFILLCTR